MSTIEIRVEGKIAQSPNAVIVCGNSDYQIHFSFSDEWNEHKVKTARFVYNGSYEDVVFEGDTVIVPVLKNVSMVFVGVYAGNLQTTTPALIGCKRSILCRNGTPADPTPDVYSQIMELLNKGGGGQGNEEVIGNDGYSTYYSSAEILKIASAISMDSVIVPEDRTVQINDFILTANGWLCQVTGIDTQNSRYKITTLMMLRGANGKSPYELAVENGFEGTEKEWLASLEGADGRGIQRITVLNGRYNIYYTDGTADSVDIPELAPKVNHDTALSETSENAVQNKVITAELKKKFDAPVVTEEDNGKFLRVVDGELKVVEMRVYNGEVR